MLFDFSLTDQVNQRRFKSQRLNQGPLLQLYTQLGVFRNCLNFGFIGETALDCFFSPGLDDELALVLADAILVSGLVLFAFDVAFGAGLILSRSTGCRLSISTQRFDFT